MKTENPVIDTLVDTQAKIMNNWMDSAKKLQGALTSPNAVTETSSISKEFLEKQMGILNNMEKDPIKETNGQVQDFFKNWFNQQAASAKQMADFTQSLQNSFSNFGKPAQDYMANFSQSNGAFNNIYSSWMNAINTSYEAMSKNMGNPFNKNVFADFMKGSQVYTKMQEFFQPMAEAMQKGKFDINAYKEFFTADSYKNLTKEMFGNFYNDDKMTEVLHDSMKQLHSFFSTQQNLSKEYFSQIENLKKNFPQMFGNVAGKNMSEFYGQVENIFGKTFEPVLKLVNPGKEKENAEALIGLMDKMTEYSIKQAELQMKLQNTARKGVEKVAEKYSTVFSDPASLTKAPDAKEMYNQWVKDNEELYTELFSSEEFSKLKGDTLNLSMEVKQQFEKQFENAFQDYPIVFKSEVEEMTKTIHDLKKQVKELRARLSEIDSAVHEDEKHAKKNKK